MQHPLIEFNPFDKTINIRSFNKRIDANDDKFWAIQTVISEILQCSISINRNKLVSLDNVGNGAAIPVDIATVDWIVNAEQWKPSPIKDLVDGVKLGMFDPSRFMFAPTIDEGMKKSRLEILKNRELFPSEFEFGEPKSVTLKSGDTYIPALAIPVNQLLREKYATPDNYVQLIQMTLVTEPNDVGLVGFVLQLLRLTI